MLRGRSIAAIFSGLTMIGGSSAALAVGETAICGGIVGISCDTDLWCDSDPGNCRGADIAGKCVAVPTACPRVFQPVCGCDDKTYGNDCERQAARIVKQSDGQCKPTDK